MLPLIVVETLVSPFKYWNGGIRSGMLYRNEFYGCLHQFAATERQQAYNKALEACKGGGKVCITVSKSHYTVWVDLRSRPNQPHGAAPKPLSAAA